MLTTGNIGTNRKAHFNFEIIEKFEAGIALLGSEVKSLRINGVSFSDSFAEIFTTDGNDEIWLLNLNIPEYKNSRIKSHEPARKRKLLLHKREITKLIGKLQQKGFSMVPLDMYFNKKGIAKVTMGLGKGKSNVDKRNTIKDRQWNKEKQRELKNNR